MNICYCETDYNAYPPTDIDWFTLQQLRDKKMLIICSRKGMAKRLRKLLNENPHIKAELVPVWEFHKLTTNGKLDLDKIYSNDVCVIVGKDRIHEVYKPLFDIVERCLIAH